MVRRILLTFISIFFLNACVSVNLGKGKPKKSDSVNLSAPASPYETIDISGTDQAWQSQKTGNTMSFFSDCSTQSDLALESLQSDILRALDKMEIKNSKNFEYNGREALQSLVSGTLDGVPILMDLIVFKKNGCSYTIVYSGKATTFKQEEANFDKFINDFKVY